MIELCYGCQLYLSHRQKKKLTEFYLDNINKYINAETLLLFIDTLYIGHRFHGTKVHKIKVGETKFTEVEIGRRIVNSSLVLTYSLV